MPSPIARVEADLKSAMKARESDRVATLRLLLSGLKNRAIEAGGELEEADLVAVTRKAVKQRHEAAEQYRKGNREELAAKEEAEIAFLEPYLPAQVDEAQIRSAVAELIAAEGLAGPRAMGQVMKAMMAKFGGSADASQISKIARELLGS